MLHTIVTKPISVPPQRHKRRIGLFPRVSEANEFVQSFTAALEKSSFETASAPVSPSELEAVDFVVYHWPWFLARGMSLRGALRGLRDLFFAQRSRGLKVVWVAHNVRPHDSGGNPLLAWLFYRQLDGVIYLSEHSRNLVRAAHKFSPRVKELITVHGTYSGNCAPKDRPLLATSAVRIFSFGQVQPYKGFDRLLRAAMETSEPAKVLLAGRVKDETFASHLHETAQKTPSITLDFRDELIPGTELDSMIDASHGVIMPYRDILNSGSALHALSRARPVLVPNLGSMPELQEQIGSQWVHLFDDPLDGRVLDRFISFVRQFDPSARPDLSNFSWDRVARDLSGFFDDLALDGK